MNWRAAFLIAGALSVMLLGTRTNAAGSEGAKSQPQTINITHCVVYSERNKQLVSDCTAVARHACDGTAHCELPIGLSLTAGKDIDPKAWKKVRVDYTCGGRAEINGPHYQDDHASMVLGCF